MMILLRITAILLLIPWSALGFQNYPYSEAGKKSWVIYNLNYDSQVYEGDTIYLIKPLAIIREHWDDGPLAYRVNPSMPMNNLYDFAQLDSVIPFFNTAVKERIEQKKKLVLLPIRSNEKMWQEFFKKYEKEFDEDRRPFSIDSSFMVSLGLLLNGKINLRYILIPYFIWSYGSNELSHRDGIRTYGPGGNLSFFNMRYLLVDQINKRVIVNCYSHQTSPNYFPWDYFRYEAYLNPSLRPFLKIVQKRKIAKHKG